MNDWVVFVSKDNAIQQVYLVLTIPVKIVAIKFMPLLFIMCVCGALVHKKTIIL